MENKEFEEKPSPTEQVTSTVKKKQNQKTQEELQLEKNLQNITKKQEKRKRRVAKLKKFQMRIKLKFQKKTIKKDHFH